MSSRQSNDCSYGTNPQLQGEWAQFVDQVALGEIGVACLAEKGGRLEGECEGEGLAEERAAPSTPCTRS